MGCEKKKVKETFRACNLLIFIAIEKLFKGKPTTTPTHLPPQHHSPNENPSCIEVDLANRYTQVISQLLVLLSQRQPQSYNEDGLTKADIFRPARVTLLPSSCHP